MGISKGQIVISKAGHDKGDALVVIAYDEKYLYVCDVKHRMLESPKRKKPMHVSFTKTVIDEESMRTNRQIRKSLAIFRNSDYSEEILGG